MISKSMAFLPTTNPNSKQFNRSRNINPHLQTPEIGSKSFGHHFGFRHEVTFIENDVISLLVGVVK